MLLYLELASLGVVQQEQEAAVVNHELAYHRDKPRFEGAKPGLLWREGVRATVTAG